MIKNILERINKQDELAKALKERKISEQEYLKQIRDDFTVPTKSVRIPEQTGKPG
jgi:uncharacterized protein YnzC (UPF0291/DUF896 family)